MVQTIMCGESKMICDSDHSCQYAKNVLFNYIQDKQVALHEEHCFVRRVHVTGKYFLLKRENLKAKK